MTAAGLGPDDLRAARAYLVALHALRAALSGDPPKPAGALLSACVSLWARLPHALRARCYLLGMEYGGPTW